MNWALVIQNGLLALIAVFLFWIFLVVSRLLREVQDHFDWDRDEWEKARDQPEQPGQDGTTSPPVPLHPGSTGDDSKSE